MKKNILLIGYIQNLGDILLSNFLYNHLNSNFNIIKIKSKYNIFEIIIKILKSQKIFIYGGVFQDISSFKSFLFYFVIIKISNIFRKKVILISTSIESLKNRFSKYLIKIIKLDFCWVRDNFSYNTLKDISKIIILKKDPVDLFFIKNNKSINNKPINLSKTFLIHKIDNISFITNTEYKFKNQFQNFKIEKLNNPVNLNLIVSINHNYNNDFKTIEILLKHFLKNFYSQIENKISLYDNKLNNKNLQYFQLKNFSLKKIKLNINTTIVYTDINEYNKKEILEPLIIKKIEKVFNNHEYNNIINCFEFKNYLCINKNNFYELFSNIDILNHSYNIINNRNNNSYKIIYHINQFNGLKENKNYNFNHYSDYNFTDNNIKIKKNNNNNIDYNNYYINFNNYQYNDYNNDNNINIIMSSRLHFNILLKGLINNSKSLNYFFYFFGEKNINYFMTHYI